MYVGDIYDKFSVKILFCKGNVLTNLTRLSHFDVS